MSEYLKLIIKQYYGKPKAMGDISLKASMYEGLAKVLRGIPPLFDIDRAEGVQLDLIGRIVVLPREVNAVIPRTFFGFDGNEYAKGFADRFDTTREGAVFYDRFEPPFSPQILNDNQYRRFLKAKILTNNATGMLAKKDDKISVQQAIREIFRGNAYVVDNQDMSADLFVSSAIGDAELRLITQLNLIPRPLGIKYNIKRF